MAGNEVASLYTTLAMVDTPFVAACEREATALEEVAVAAEATTATVAEGEKVQAAAVEATAAKTEASQGRMARGWANLTSAVEENGTKTSRVWDKVTHLGKMSAIGLLAIGAASVHMASDFQSSMELVHTQAGASQSEVDALSGSVLKLAGTVGQSPDKLAEGLYHIESAGFRGQAAMDILAAASKDAAIGMSDMETTSQALIGTMAVGFKDVRDAADAAAFLNTTVGIGDMRMEKLAAAISTGVLPSFKSAGLGMTDFSAALATLTDNVTPADEAATRLRMTVALMAAPSSKAASALESIGLSSTDLATDMRKPDGLLVAVTDLKRHLEETFPTSAKSKLTTAQMTAELKKYAATLTAAGVETSQQKTLLDAYSVALKQNGTAAVKQNQALEQAFGGGRTSGAILTLIEESDRLSSKYAAIGTESSRAAQMQDAWAATQGTFKQNLHEVGAQIEVIGVQVGNWLLPKLTTLFRFFAEHTGVMKVFFAVIVAGMLAFTAAVVANSIAMLANPTVWVVIAIVTAVTALGVAIYELVTKWHAVWADVKATAAAVWKWLVGAWNDTWSAITSAFDATIGWFKKLPGRIVGALASLGSMLMHVGSLAVHKLFYAIGYGLGLIVREFIDFPGQVVDATVNLVVALGVIGGKIIDWFVSLPGQIVAVFVNAGKLLYQIGVNILKGLLDGFLWMFGFGPDGGVGGWLSKVGDKIVGFFKDARHWLYEAGRQIITGLWDGIKSVWNSVSGWFKDRWHDIQNGFDNAFSGPQKAVSQPINHYASGGWVTAPYGQAQLAFVHGGEFVVSNDMQAGRRAMPFLGGGRGGGATQVTVHVENHNHNYIDGKKMYDNTITNANRRKARNTATGVT